MPLQGRPAFCVVDVETTGLGPRTNRVIEIAVVSLDEHGRRVGEFSTLLNPGRDVGPTRIHRITASDVEGAPTFSDVAAQLHGLLAGRVFVAHNASFDWRFLVAEYERLGVTLPEPALLCTMRLADEFLPGVPARNLLACCAHARVIVDGHHSALSDARAAADLLGCYRASRRAPDNWWQSHVDAAAASASRWSGVPASPDVVSVTRSHIEARRAAEASFLSKLVSAAPRTFDGDVNMDAYLAVLDSALEDRRLTDAEQGQLAELAADLALSGPHLEAAHQAYLLALAATAWADDVITDVELGDLHNVAKLLGLADSDVAAALQSARARSVAPLPVADADVLHVGDAVAFTGDTVTRRESLEAQARAAGLRVTGSVSGRTALLVAADSASQSGKATRAAALGTRVVSEVTFLRLLRSIQSSGNTPPAARRPPVVAAVPAQRDTGDGDDIATGAAGALAGRRVVVVDVTDAQYADVTAVLAGAGGSVGAYVKDSLACVVTTNPAHEKAVRAVQLAVAVLTPAEFLERYAAASPEGVGVNDRAELGVAGRSFGATVTSTTGTHVAGTPAGDPHPAVTPAPSAAAGWYADPWQAAPLRWWDGQAWTPHLHG